MSGGRNPIANLGAGPRSERVLFVLPKVARPVVSVPRLQAGEEGLSGTEASALLVADGLAVRGWDVGMWMRREPERVESGATLLRDEAAALSWVGQGRIIVLTWQQDLIDRLSLPVWVWSQLPLSMDQFAQVRQGKVAGIIVVSDTVRLPFIHAPASDRIVRIYNPLNPYFDHSEPVVRHVKRRGQVVFTGFIGESKGVHRLLQIWNHARSAAPFGRLLIAGSAGLYDGERETGPFGVAEEAFERAFLLPLVQRFGSLEAAGVHFIGLKTPRELRQLYLESEVGVVNPNWYDFTETFCCAGTEMLATGLPVLAVRAGALPETLGRSGGAMMASTPDIRRTGVLLGEALNGRPDLRPAAIAASSFVTDEYAIDRVLDEWERLLDGGDDKLKDFNQRWHGPRGTRYALERIVRRTHLGRYYRAGIDALNTFRNDIAGC